MERYNRSKYWEKQPCKFDPNNEGLGCCQPRVCSRCGFNPAVAKRRLDRIVRKLKEAKCNG